VRSAETDIRYGDVGLDVRPAAARPESGVYVSVESAASGDPDVSAPALGPAEIALPPGLTVKAKLATAIDSAHARVASGVKTI
jgi:hypothetical protein